MAEIEGPDGPPLRRPWLVAAWPGMAAVGARALTHLARQLGATRLAEVDTAGHFDIVYVAVEDGLFLRARRPRAWLLGWRSPAPDGRDLVLLVGEAQPTTRAWDFARTVVSAARELGVARIVTLASMASPIEADAAPVVQGAATEASLRDELRRHDVLPLDAGEIGGMNGILLGAAAEAGLPGLCLLGQFPYFARAFPNPRASAAVLRAFSRLSGIAVDVSELEEEASDLQETLLELQAHARQLAARPGPEANGTGSEADTGGDEAARARIETLFEAAATDRAKALALKAELDRLGLFPEYEDRFLDLFKRGE
jgi:uncharacterized protein